MYADRPMCRSSGSASTAATSSTSVARSRVEVGVSTTRRSFFHGAARSTSASASVMGSPESSSVRSSGQPSSTFASSAVSSRPSITKCSSRGKVARKVARFFAPPMISSSRLSSGGGLAISASTTGV
jgi:hypothetical protein